MDVRAQRVAISNNLRKRSYPGQYAFNPDVHVTPNTPPTFLLQAETDSTDNVNQSLVYYIALKDAGVPTENTTPSL